MDDRTQALLDRTFRFGVDVLKHLKNLPDDYIYRIPKGQLGRSALSVGSNYEEAQGASSKRDFTFKIGISYRESRESVYWLRVLKELYPDKKFEPNFTKFIVEAEELKKIFGAIKKIVFWKIITKQ